MQQQLTLARGHCLSFGSICLHAAAGANGLSTYIHLFMCYGSYNKLIWWQCVTAIDPHVPHLVASHIQPAETAVQSGDPQTQTKHQAFTHPWYERWRSNIQKRIWKCQCSCSENDSTIKKSWSMCGKSSSGHRVKRGTEIYLFVWDPTHEDQKNQALNSFDHSV